MVTALDILPDRYRSGRYLRRWTWVDGFPRCVEDALDTATASAADISAAEAGNLAVHDALVVAATRRPILPLTLGRPRKPCWAA
jgi:hypothetical protein